MLEPLRSETPAKCFLTQGQLPKYNDPKQPSSKTKPFSTVLEHPFLHSVSLLLPSSFYHASSPSILSALTKAPEYAVVNFTLLDVISNPFFTTYIKTGTIALHSVPPRPGANDPLITLFSGLLRLELPRDLYERAGLSGQPIRSGSRKHIPERFAVEINLRLPSMVAGRKGFERLKRAAEQVLNHKMKFLFADCEKGEDGQPWSVGDALRPVWAFEPQVRMINAEMQEANVNLPEIKLEKGANQGDRDLTDAVFDDEAMELLEWVDLVTMQSPRVAVGDEIDPFLSRYVVPGLELNTPKQEDIVCLSWKGFIPSEWVRDMLLLWLNAARKDELCWFALSGHAFRVAAVDSKLGWTVLRLPEKATSTLVSRDEDVHMHGTDEDADDRADANNGSDSDPENRSKLSDASKSSLGKTKRTKPFPQFVLYEITAGEYG